MDWRMVMRRCHRRSMTLVGDLAQTGSDAGVRSWAELLDQYAPDHWRTAELTVNYRTPAEIMAVADDVLAALEVVAAEQARIGDGRLAVIVPGSRYAELTALVSTALPGVASGSDPALLDASTAILKIDQVKGLEFDSVLIADPGAILRESPRGGSDLYVAVTRATKRLGVITDGSLPDVLHRIGPEE